MKVYGGKHMTVICFLVNSHFTFIYNCAKLSCRSVTTNTYIVYINFDLNRFAILLIKSNFYWKTSLARVAPNGITVNRNQPILVLKVVR